MHREMEPVHHRVNAQHEHVTVGILDQSVVFVAAAVMNDSLLNGRLRGHIRPWFSDVT